MNLHRLGRPNTRWRPATLLLCTGCATVAPLPLRVAPIEASTLAPCATPVVVPELAESRLIPTVGGELSLVRAEGDERLSAEDGGVLAAWSRDSTLVAFSDHGAVTTWRAGGGKLVDLVRCTPGDLATNETVWSGSVDPPAPLVAALRHRSVAARSGDGSIVAAVDHGRLVLERARRCVPLDRVLAPFGTLAFTPDGTQLYAALHPNNARESRVWSTDTGAALSGLYVPPSTGVYPMPSVGRVAFGVEGGCFQGVRGGAGRVATDLPDGRAAGGTNAKALPWALAGGADHSQWPLVHHVAFWVIMTSMKRMSVAEAKAHFSELVSDARRGKKTVILRHGTPAAAVVPAAAVEPVRPPVAMTRKQALAVFESFAHLGDPTVDAVAELKAGRR